jgi:hypothetical protein
MTEHEHKFERFATWRKYDLLECSYVAKKQRKLKPGQNVKKNTVPKRCKVVVFALTPSRPVKEKNGVVMVKPPVIVSVKPQNNAFWKDFQYAEA